MSQVPVRSEDGKVWEVFAKFKQKEPLRHIGSVISDSPDLAAVYARTLYDEWGWSGMIVVPREKIVHLIGPK